MADLRTLQSGLSGSYTLDRELGRGGMATVYLARDLKHDRPVALKVLHPELAVTLGPERFQREIRFAARLQHPHELGRISGRDHAGRGAPVQGRGPARRRTRVPAGPARVEPVNFLPRITIPVLMLNGQYDHYFPVESSQRPMFNLLGTPADKKRLVISEGGHFVPRTQLVQETLDWLDRYLGPMSQAAE